MTQSRIDSDSSVNSEKKEIELKTIKPEMKPMNIHEFQDFIATASWEQIVSEINETKEGFIHSPSELDFNIWRDQISIAMTYVNNEHVKVLVGDSEKILVNLAALKKKREFVQAHLDQFTQAVTQWNMPPAPQPGRLSTLYNNFSFITSWWHHKKTEKSLAPEEKKATETAAFYASI